MRVVKPTYPPSMAVIVDPIVTSATILELPPAHPTMDRIDSVYAKVGFIGVSYGSREEHPVPAPTPPGTRPIAHIYVFRASTVITDRNIEELM